MAIKLRATAPRPDPAAVLTKAFLRAGDELGVTRRALARTIGVSEASLSRLTTGRTIDPATKEGELALVFVRAFRSLDALLGGATPKAREWLHAANFHLGGCPVDLIQTASGLIHVADYLDAMRGSVSSPTAEG